ncbi:MAG: PAS domain S-box protein, partial [Candidatus Pacebacteria bacterium]|nr:PAS domain S-box protein [Candidatus Paceibacterota bacterium]
MPTKKKQTKNQDKDLQSLQEEIDDLEWFIEDFSTFLPLAVCTVNSFGIITNINKAFEKLIGYNALEIVREKLDKFFLNSEDIEKVTSKAKKENVFQTEIIVLCKNGKHIPVSLSIATRETREGEFIGYFVALTDIAELKKLQTNLEGQVAEKTKELQEKLRTLEKFTKLTVGRELKMVELKKKI